MRKSPVILLIVELVLAVALGQMGSIRRPELDRAFMEWHQHPTVESREALDRQKWATELARLGFSGVVFAVLAGATIFVFWLRRGEQDGAANRSQPIRSETNRRPPNPGTRRCGGFGARVGDGPAGGLA